MGSLTASIITEREKAAIRLHIYGGVNDWRLLFVMAGGEGPGSATGLASYVSKWKQSPKIKQEIADLTRQKALEDEATIRREIERYEREGKKTDEGVESLRPERETKKGLDFYDPVNQKKLLNDLINTAKDPDEKLDALKIITATQRDDRQAAKEGRQVRAYLPLNCSDCPLYLKAKAQKPTKG